jgi:hypothetical protein
MHWLYCRLDRQPLGRRIATRQQFQQTKIDLAVYFYLKHYIISLSGIGSRAYTAMNAATSNAFTLYQTAMFCNIQIEKESEGQIQAY